MSARQSNHKRAHRRAALSHTQQKHNSKRNRSPRVRQKLMTIYACIIRNPFSPRFLMLIDINRAVRWKCNFNHEKRGLICFYFSSRLLFSVEGFGRWEIDNPLIDKKADTFRGGALRGHNWFPSRLIWAHYLFIRAGIDSIGFDPQRFAMDYHIIGFRECASEVARYLVTIEGMDIQDPLRLRLMSHLQCFVAQRELSAKTTAPGVAASPNWSTLQNTYQTNYSSQGYQAYPGTAPITPHQQHSNQQQNSFNSTYMSAPSSSTPYLSSTLTSQSPEYSSSGYGTSANSSSSIAANSTASNNNTTTTSPAPIQPSSTGDQQQADGQQPIYTDLSNSSDRLLNLGGSYHYANANQLYGSANNNGYNNNNNNNNNSKPYRPWHPEMAYWNDGNLWQIWEWKS